MFMREREFVCVWMYECIIMWTCECESGRCAYVSMGAYVYMSVLVCLSICACVHVNTRVCMSVCEYV